MPEQVVFTRAEIESFSSLLYRVADELAGIENATHPQLRHSEELKEVAAEMLMRAEAGTTPDDSTLT
jgi:hypothetical protein